VCVAQYMHEQNIMHRDLKTQNIFLTKSKVIKVGDLGIARQVCVYVSLIQIKTIGFSLVYLTITNVRKNLSAEVICI